MDLLDTIRNRRTVMHFRPDPVPRAILEEMIEYAVWAPNHHLTEPWQFVVVEGESLKDLAQFRHDAVLKANFGRPQAHRVADKARDDFVSVPAVIIAIQKLEGDGGRHKEDYAAMSCAIYNMLLVAWKHKVGTYWGTGPLLKHKATRQWLGLGSHEEIVGIVKVGYPAELPDVGRTPGMSHTRWLS